MKNSQPPDPLPAKKRQRLSSTSSIRSTKASESSLQKDATVPEKDIHLSIKHPDTIPPEKSTSDIKTFITLPPVSIFQPEDNAPVLTEMKPPADVSRMDNTHSVVILGDMQELADGRLTELATCSLPESEPSTPSTNLQTHGYTGNTIKVNLVRSTSGTRERTLNSELPCQIPDNKAPTSHHIIYLKDRSRRKATDDGPDSDNESIISTTSTNASTASSYHRVRLHEVKTKLRAMKKDQDGHLIIDKSTFPLGDLIYLNRFSGKKKTGLQKRREEREKERLLAKQAKSLKNIKESSPSVSLATEPNHLDETNNNKSNEENKTEEQVDVVPLSKDEITKKNKQSFANISVSMNESGELVVGDVHSLNHPNKLDVNDALMERELEDPELDDQQLFRRCFHKRKKNNIDPNQKMRTIASKRWRPAETSLFWEALSKVGQDFSLMECYFRGRNVNRTKLELKTKFQREDKIQGERITYLLKRAASKPLNFDDFTHRIPEQTP